MTVTPLTDGAPPSPSPTQSVSAAASAPGPHTARPGRRSDGRSPGRRPPLRRQLGAFILRLHFYAGMAVGPFILVAALSGALYALTPTAEEYVYRDLTTVPAVAAPVPLHEQVDAAQRSHPELTVAQVWPAQQATDSTRVLFDVPADAEGNPLAVFVDPSDARVLGEEATYSSLGELPLRRWVSGLHESLNLGAPGEVYSEFAASWLWIIALGGLWLWWRRVRAARRRGARPARLWLPLRGRGSTPPSAGTPATAEAAGGDAAAPAAGTATPVSARRDTAVRRRGAMNIHAVTGVWLLVAVLGLSATGITWSHFAGDNVNAVVTAMKWKATPIDTELPGSVVPPGHEGHAGHAGHGGDGAHAGHAGHGGAGGDAAATVSPRTVSAQIERVVVAARKAGLTGALTVRPPATPTSTWQVNERWVPWRTTSDAVSVDGRDGGIVDRQDFGDLPLFSRLSAWGIYLHMGIMFGLPLQIALCVVGLGIALIVVQGYRMWWHRRPTRPGSRAGLDGVPGVPSTLPWGAYGCVVVFAVTVGVFLPLVGVSLVVFTVLDAALATARSRRRVRGGARGR
ncbi:PepSY-associated TM helix domain-containing protein [Corynebacterium bovis]|uniref:PepSY-associated TM helix domain-containing protein n=1 Tax=Corynebacterium bovis TaxID=36808 RepID=UPI003138EFE2